MGADEFVDIHPPETEVLDISKSSGGILHFTLNGGKEKAGCEPAWYSA
jgi:hypothetical protein